MANQWLRLWHDMPTDPKWRTIARASGQPISLVQAVYLHLLVDASRNVTRGHATVTQEDLASALDVTEDAIRDVLASMQGRVLAEMRLLGWEARQPKREDSGDESTGAKSAAQRKAEQRERERQAALDAAEQQCHDASRDVTLDKDKEEIKKEEKKAPRVPRSPTPVLDGIPPELLAEYLQIRKAKKAGPLTATAIKGLRREAAKASLTLEQAVTACIEFSWQGFNAGWYAERMSSGQVRGVVQHTPAADPDSREAIEAEGVAKGLGPWGQLEQFALYKARVRGPAPKPLSLDQLVGMAPRQGVTA